MMKVYEKGVYCEDVITHVKRVFKTMTDAAIGLGVSQQAVSYAIKKKGRVKDRYELRFGLRFYAVKNRQGNFFLCRYVEDGNKFADVSADGVPIYMRSVESFRDVTYCLINEAMVGIEGELEKAKRKKAESDDEDISM